MIKKILVTGGAGFIGSHVVDELLSNGYSVVVVDNLSTGKLDNLPKDNIIKFIRGNVVDSELIESVVDEVDGIIHLAAQVSVAASIDDPISSAQVNILGFLNVLTAAKDYNKPMVYASSAAIYGNRSKPPVKESAPATPMSPYGLEKYINDQYSSLYHELYGYKSSGLRFFNVYGPRQDPSSQYSGVISIFADRISKSQPITIYGDGEQTRDFIYVKDVAEAIIIALKSETCGVFNVSTNIPTTLNNLAGTISSITGNNPDITYAPARNGDIRYSFADNTKLGDLGKKSYVSLRDGLSKLLESL